jgi:hypothetical protein
MHARNSHLKIRQSSVLKKQYQACPIQPDFFSIQKYDVFAKIESLPIPYLYFLFLLRRDMTSVRFSSTRKLRYDEALNILYCREILFAIANHRVLQILYGQKGLIFEKLKHFRCF